MKRLMTEDLAVMHPAHKMELAAMLMTAANAPHADCAAVWRKADALDAATDPDEPGGALRALHLDFPQLDRLTDRKKLALAQELLCAVRAETEGKS